jgi:hypothetical protein
VHSRRHSARRQPLGDVRTDSSAVGSSRHPRGVRPKRGPTPEVHRPRRYLLNHHSAPSSAQTARSTVLLAASSVRDAPTRRSARGRVGVGGLAAVEAQHAAERRDVIARSSSEDEILLHWMSLQVACAVKRRRFPVGASPTRQPLQPEATGAAMEETKWLEPSDWRVTIYGDSASVQAVTRVNAEQTSKRTMRRPTRPPYRGRLTRLGEVSEAIRPDAAPG